MGEVLGGGVEIECWREIVPVLLQEARRLTVHIQFRSIKFSMLRREFHIKLSSEEDHCFLYKTAVTQEIYQRFVHYHNLDVPFDQFSDYMHHLIHSVKNSQDYGERFFINIYAHPGTHLPPTVDFIISQRQMGCLVQSKRLCLTFALASDAELKEHLISCFDRLKREKDHAQRRNSELETELMAEKVKLKEFEERNRYLQKELEFSQTLIKSAETLQNHYEALLKQQQHGKDHIIQLPTPPGATLCGDNDNSRPHPVVMMTHHHRYSQDSSSILDILPPPPPPSQPLPPPQSVPPPVAQSMVSHSVSSNLDNVMNYLSSISAGADMPVPTPSPMVNMLPPLQQQHQPHPCHTPAPAPSMVPPQQQLHQHHHQQHAGHHHLQVEDEEQQQQQQLRPQLSVQPVVQELQQQQQQIQQSQQQQNMQQNVMQQQQNQQSHSNNVSNSILSSDPKKLKGAAKRKASFHNLTNPNNAANSSLEQQQQQQSQQNQQQQQSQQQQQQQQMEQQQILQSSQQQQQSQPQQQNHHSVLANSHVIPISMETTTLPHHHHQQQQSQQTAILHEHLARLHESHHLQQQQQQQQHQHHQSISRASPASSLINPMNLLDEQQRHDVLGMEGPSVPSISNSFMTPGVGLHEYLNESMSHRGLNSSSSLSPALDSSTNELIDGLSELNESDWTGMKMEYGATDFPVDLADMASSVVDSAAFAHSLTEAGLLAAQTAALANSLTPSGGGGCGSVESLSPTNGSAAGGGVDPASLAIDPSKLSMDGVLSYFKCLLCDCSFNVGSSHMAQHVTEMQTCAICADVPAFESKDDLVKHMLGHSARIYACQYCGKENPRVHYLKIHVRSHTGEKPYTCHQCGRGFADASTWRRHERVHTGEKPYQCNICGRKIARRDNVKIHMRSHMRSKPQSACRTCGKAFSQLNHLSLHERICGAQLSSSPVGTDMKPPLMNLSQFISTPPPPPTSTQP